MGHSKYGPISLVFGKDTVDPEFFRSNKVYGSDAWTPTRPAVEYPVNGKKLQAIEHEIHRLAGGAAVAGGIFGNSSALRSMGVDNTSSKSTDELAEALAQTAAPVTRSSFKASNARSDSTIHAIDVQNKRVSIFSLLLIVLSASVLVLMFPSPVILASALQEKRGGSFFISLVSALRWG